MLFSKKWLKNHPQLLLYFLIHIDVLMLCRKFQLIPTKIFRVMAIFNNKPIFEKYPVLYPMLFSKKWLQIHLQLSIATEYINGAKIQWTDTHKDNNNTINY